ncbi:hypothetical protein MNBD_GAMMA07-1021 [hydrothermal vent metagenome]|uniref:DUF4412 domain-containing protein n=1 Tax=hydrothermal vent metagenome TaxID=652676 RepID=A0A3B0XIE1_9ZZZZ
MIVKYLALVFFIISTANAAVTDKQFSADAIISIPGKAQTSSRIYVGKNVIRTEIQTQNGLIVDIVYPLEGKLIKLNPRLKQYFEIPIEKYKNDLQINENPCYRLKNTTCTKLKEENINGLITQKWKIVALEKGKSIKTLHWIDIQRQLAIKEIFSDGSRVDMILKKNEIINNRKVEKWVRTLSRSDGLVINSFQWYDPQLKMAIREELPGGYVRELMNIKIGVQENILFEIPKNYSAFEADLYPNKS